MCEEGPCESATESQTTKYNRRPVVTAVHSQFASDAVVSDEVPVDRPRTLNADSVAADIPRDAFNRRRTRRVQLTFPLTSATRRLGLYNSSKLTH